MKITFFFIISLFARSLYSMGACWDGSYEQHALNRCCKVTAPLCMLIACCAQVKHISDSHPVVGDISDSFRGVQNIFYAKKRGEKDEKFKV